MGEYSGRNLKVLDAVNDAREKPFRRTFAKNKNYRFICIPPSSLCFGKQIYARTILQALGDRIEEQFEDKKGLLHLSVVHESLDDEDYKDTEKFTI